VLFSQDNHLSITVVVFADKQTRFTLKGNFSPKRTFWGQLSLVEKVYSVTEYLLQIIDILVLVDEYFPVFFQFFDSQSLVFNFPV
jgi:hypothetical protein